MYVRVWLICYVTCAYVFAHVFMFTSVVACTYVILMDVCVCVCVHCREEKPIIGDLMSQYAHFFKVCIALITFLVCVCACVCVCVCTVRIC